MTRPRWRRALVPVALAVVLNGALGFSWPELHGQIQDAPSSIRVGVARAGGGYSVVPIDLETYVARVLGGEAAPNTAAGAIQALAIAVRTYALVNLGRHAAEGFDVCDQVHCQVVRTANADTEGAAQATAGQVLLNAGVPAPIYYSASCGGQTEIPSAVWPDAEDPSYMPSRPDDACRGEPVWASQLTRDDLQRALAAAGFRGALRHVAIVSRGVSGRVAKLSLDGMTPAEISAQDLRMAVSRTMGPLQIKSAAFELRRAGDDFLFNGRGYGHGVGMCVFGAMRLAEAGESAAAILTRYFPGLTIGVPGWRATTGLTVILPPSNATEQAAITAAAARARDELAQTLGVSPPASITLRFHPAPSSYERATSRGWYTSGAVVNGEVHLLPVGTLRARGMLERSVRRQLVELLTAEELRGRPQWVRDGLAMHLAEQRETDARERPDRRVRCPEDSELLAPTSAGAYAEAAARARACVARELNRGRSWREIAR